MWGGGVGGEIRRSPVFTGGEILEEILRSMPCTYGFHDALVFCQSSKQGVHTDAQKLKATP